MKLVVSNWRLTSRLVLSLTLFVSNVSQLALLVTSNRGATALAANQSADSSDDRRKLEQTEDKRSRPRRIETKHEAQPGPGPLIRVALVTDVLTVALSSSFGFKVRSDETSLSQSKSVPGTSMTVELRQLSEPVDREPAIAVYRVSVGSSHDSRRAQKLADELKKRFFEPVSMSFDQKNEEYTVLIGKFKSRSEASLFHDRLRKSGFDDLRVLNDSSGQLSDANSRTDKYRAQPTSTGRSSVKSDRRLSKLVAVSADRIAATSERELVIAPAQSPRPLDQNQDSSHESGTGSRPVSTKDHDPVRDLRARTDATPVMKVGKSEYRGEIKLILNSRGRINVVNELPLEDYLRGVVPLELSPGIYPEIEALKAQAIAARSYALTRIGRNRDEGYDLVDDTRAQVYGGISAERALTNRAIDETRGIAVVFVDDDGNLAPIEALYTANCGGRTENNEEVFGGKAAPYLRGVSCSPDRQTPASGNIISSRTRDSMFGVTGRSLAKEVAILSVLGFSLPNRVTGNYLSRAPERDELRSWLQQIVRFTQKTMPPLAIRGDGIRLIEFARLIASCIYGGARAKTLLSPADVDYLLEGLPVHSVPLDARPDLALLLKDGILNLPGGFLDARETITRGQAIETLARAISSHHKPALKPSPSILKSPTTDPLANIPNLVSDIALPAQNGRLVISTPGSASSNSRDDAGLAKSGNGARESGASPQNQSAKATPSTREPSRRGQQTTLEISEDVWLFRNLGGQSYQVDRVNIIGGERVVYHLNAKGKVDFLEASTSDRSAASDRFSSVAQWQERISAEDLQQKLMRAGVDVGRLEEIEPVSFSSSNRVNELEITGEYGRARLRRSQIRSLGLKEYLFVVDREADERGRTVAFVFPGRGWGHGVGMCQTGAYGLAREGYSHTAILQRYYTGVKLRKLY